ncbi:unnamed protein product, partial [Hapterophycus canaliculatus]
SALQSAIEHPAQTFLLLIMRSRILSVCLSGCAYGIRTSHGFVWRASACGVNTSCAAAGSTSTLLRSPPQAAARPYSRTASATGGGGGGGVTHGALSLSSNSAAGEVEVEMGQ